MRGRGRGRWVVVSRWWRGSCEGRGRVGGCGRGRGGSVSGSANGSVSGCVDCEDMLGLGVRGECFRMTRSE